MMKERLLLGILLIGLVFGSGCTVPAVLPLVTLLEEVEKEVPPPAFLAPYFSSGQAVPLNNIPNADMENWSVTWVGSGSGNHFYTGDIYYEGSSFGIMSNKSGCGYLTSYSVKSPQFILEHEYISFYAYNIYYGGVCQGNSNRFIGSGDASFIIYDSSGNIISKKKIIDMPASAYVVSDVTKIGVFLSTYTKGTLLGEDGKTWYNITVPLPTSFVGQNVSYGFEIRGTSSYNPITPYIYVDNLYYSTSTGDEIYLLEAPTAQFTYVVNGYNVAVDANISQTAGTLYQIKWNWGDGTQTTGVESTHAYAFPGNKQITLTIMDNENLVDTATLVVSVDGTSYYAGPEGSNTPKIAPVAGFSYGISGMTITVDGSYSTDDGTISLYTWDFDGVKKNGVTATHTYDNSGTKTVTLIVKDNIGLEGSRKIVFTLPVGGITQSTIIVDNPGKPPVAKFTYALTTPTITVDASGSSDDVKIETYSWNWGDGSTSVGKTSTHTYSDMGTQRTVVLTVTDNEGFSDTAEVMIATQSYNAPTPSDPNIVTVVPPTITGGSTPSTPSTPYTPPAKAFPVWGAIVTLGVILLSVGLVVYVFGGKGKKKRNVIFGKGGKRR